MSEGYREIWRPPNLSQPQQGYRFTTDAFSLASFALGFPFVTFADLGTGSGVIAHVLASRRPASQGLAVERQTNLLAHAKINLADLPVRVIAADVRELDWQAEKLDLVVCNPPYYEVHAGHVNQDLERAEARHTFFGTLWDFATFLQPALSEGGVFCFIFPFQLADRVVKRLKQQGWYLWRQLNLCSFVGRQPKLVCLAFGREALAEPQRHTLVVWQAHRQFTNDMQYFLRDGCLPAREEY